MVASPRADGARPDVSVILAVLDEEETLGAQLDALARQTYPGRWEVVIADNGCTDRSMAIVDHARPRLPALTVIDASARAGDAYAKNRAVDAARGDIIVSCDGDDVVQPGWMEALVHALATCDIAYGIADVVALNPPEVNRWYWSRRLGPLRFGMGGGNIGCWKSVWEALGGWNENIRYGADAEFRMRAEDAGRDIALTDEARILVRRRSTLLASGRQAFAGGFGLAQRVALHPHWAGRESGMTRRRVLRQWAFVLVAWPAALVRPGTRGLWVRVAASLAGRLWAQVSLRWRGPAGDAAGPAAATTPIPAPERPSSTG